MHFYSLTADTLYLCLALTNVLSVPAICKGLVSRYICIDVQISGVAEVHDLHVWCIKPGMPILAAHVTSTDARDGEAVLSSVTNYCRSFGIDHSTIQVSDSACPCKPESASLNGSDHQHTHGHNHDHDDQHQGGHDHGHSHTDGNPSDQHCSHGHQHVQPTDSSHHDQGHDIV